MPGVSIRGVEDRELQCSTHGASGSLEIFRPRSQLDQTTVPIETVLLYLQTVQHSLICGSQLTKVSVWGDEDQIQQTALWSCDCNQPVAFAEGLTVPLDRRCSAEIY